MGPKRVVCAWAPAACEMRRQTVNYCLSVLTFFSPCLLRSLWLTLQLSEPWGLFSHTGNPNPNTRKPEFSPSHLTTLNVASPEKKKCSGGATELCKTAGAWQGLSDSEREQWCLGNELGIPSCALKTVLQDAEPAPGTRSPHCPPAPIYKANFPQRSFWIEQRAK